MRAMLEPEREVKRSSSPGALTPAARCFVIAAVYAAAVMSVGLAIYGLSAGAEEVPASKGPRSSILSPPVEIPTFEEIVPSPSAPFPSASQAVLLTFSAAVAVGLLAVGGRAVLPHVTRRRLVVGVAVAVVVLFAVLVWPTRSAFHSGPGGQLIRVDRLTGDATFVRPTSPRR